MTDGGARSCAEIQYLCVWWESECESFEEDGSEFAPVGVPGPVFFFIMGDEVFVVDFDPFT